MRCLFMEHFPQVGISTSRYSRELALSGKALIKLGVSGFAVGFYVTRTCFEIVIASAIAMPI